MDDLPNRRFDQTGSRTGSANGTDFRWIKLTWLLLACYPQDAESDRILIEK
jgi:hypothetical protein